MIRVWRQAGLVAHILRWRLSWRRYDCGYCPTGLPAKFISAAEAARRIPDQATVITAGLGASARCSIFFWAVRERFEAQGHPRGLTWLSVGAQGGRGKVPGTVEELALPGLLARYISGHVETARALLALGEAGQLEIHTLPQGEMTHLIEAQGAHRTTLVSQTGVDTFLDPRGGTGSAVTAGAAAGLIEPHPDGLTYRLPEIDVALFNVPWADTEGNLYFFDAANLTETVEAADAARASGGQVIAAVAGLVKKDASRIGLSADRVDAIVVNPGNEQIGSVPQRRCWPVFTPRGTGDAATAAAELMFVNRVMGITPKRDAADEALARLGAAVFAAHVAPGATVNVGVGHPEDVCRLLYLSSLGQRITFTTETGVVGGLPAPGIFFGAAINPQRLESSAWMFHHYRENLDAALLGMLEMDARGNVNVSRRGAGVRDYVGPGGFPSIAHAARTVIFVGAWMTRARYGVEPAGLRLLKPGPPKFVTRVREITFSAEQARAMGKQVFYVTHAGVFRLTRHGLQMTHIMPGLNFRRDVQSVTGDAVDCPPGGPERVDPAVLTGQDFSLHWAAGEPAPQPSTQGEPAHARR